MASNTVQPAKRHTYYPQIVHTVCHLVLVLKYLFRLTAQTPHPGRRPIGEDAPDLESRAREKSVF